MKKSKRPSFISFKDIAVLLNEYEAHELEFQYEAANKNTLTKIANLCETLQQESSGPITCRPGSEYSRPISAYLDHEDLALAETGITLRVRYGGFRYKPMSGLKIELQSSKIFQQYAACSSDITGSLALKHIKNRLELEENINPQTFNGTIKEFLSINKATFKQKFEKTKRHEIYGALNAIRMYLENKMGTKPLKPIFATDAKRKCYVVEISLPDKKVAFEIALDECRYYEIKNKTLWPSEQSEGAAQDNGLLSGGHNIKTAKINGTLLEDCPLVEFEFKKQFSKGNITKQDIIAAETILRAYMTQNLGDQAIIPKELSKGEYGYDLLNRKKQKHITTDFKAAAGEVAEHVRALGRAMRDSEQTLRKKTIGNGKIAEEGEHYEANILNYIHGLKTAQSDYDRLIRMVAHEIAQLSKNATNLLQKDLVDRLYLSLADELEILGLRASKKRSALLVNDEGELVEWSTNGLCPGIPEKVSYYVKGEHGKRGQWLRCAEMRAMSSFMGMKAKQSSKKGYSKTSDAIDKFVHDLGHRITTDKKRRHAERKKEFGSLTLYASDVPCMLCNDLLVKEDKNRNRSLTLKRIVTQSTEKNAELTAPYRRTEKSLERFRDLHVDVIQL